MRKKIVGGGGLVAYYGTNSLFDVEKACEANDEKALLYYEGMAYQVAKEIGRCAAALSGDVQAIVLAGGAAEISDTGNLDNQEGKIHITSVGIPRRG